MEPNVVDTPWISLKIGRDEWKKENPDQNSNNNNTEEMELQQRYKMALWNEYVCRNDTLEQECTGPHHFDDNPLSIFIYGYISPPLVLVTLITNCLVCLILMKKTVRSPTNVLLVAMAVSDTLTGIWPLPFYIGVYTTGWYADWIPYRLCFPYFCLTEYFPIVSHTASIWLTVALAVQRYVYVCHPIAAKRLCSIRNAVFIVIGVYTSSLCSQLCRFFEYDFFPIELKSVTEPSTFITGCYEQYSFFVGLNPGVFYNVYYWLRVIFIHLVPCTSLVVLNAILIHALKVAQLRRSQLLMQNRRAESKRLQESNSTTMMLVSVVGLFLLVELPLAVFLIALICNNAGYFNVFSSETITMISLLINFFIMLSYPLNFFIYCGMSRQFRETFKGLFTNARGTVVKNAEQTDASYVQRFVTLDGAKVKGEGQVNETNV